MTLSTKILIWLGALTIISALSFIIYKQIDISRRQEAIEQNVVLQKQLVDGIVRSQASWATREDVEGLIKSSSINLKTIQKDLDKLNANVSTINIAVATSQGQRVNNISTTPGPAVNPNPVDPANPDPFGYLKQQQTLSLNEKFGTVELPIGSVGFSAWQKEPWNYDIKTREYHLNTVVGTDENQRQYFYNKFVVKIDGKDYTVPINSAITEQVYPESKWSWWNPRLYLGIDGGLNISKMQGEFAPNVSISFMSYGKYKIQPDFSILGLGAGYGIISEKLQLILTPVTYNVGQHIPLMNNTYVGPSIYIGLNGNVSFMVGTKIGL